MLPNVVCFYEAGVVAGAGVEAEAEGGRQRSPGNQAAAGAGRVLSWGHLHTIHGDISLSEEKPNSQETYNSVVI